VPTIAKEKAREWQMKKGENKWKRSNCTRFFFLSSLPWCGGALDDGTTEETNGLGLVVLVVPLIVVVGNW
jgi:hypothetical protein